MKRTLFLCSFVISTILPTTLLLAADEKLLAKPDVLTEETISTGTRL